MADNFNASGENSSVFKPIPKNAKRPRDKDVGEKPAPRLKDGVNKEAGDLITTATSVTAEELKNILSNDETLSEEFIEKASALFEAAVIERVNEIQNSLEEQFDETVETRLGDIQEELAERIDTFLEFVAEKWLEDNAVEIDRSVRTQIAESFLEDMKTVFDNNFINIPEDKVDIAEAQAERIAELEEQLNELIQENLSYSKNKELEEALEIVDELAEGLSDSQKDKFVSIAENVDFSNTEELRKKLTTIREGYNQKSPKQENYLNESYLPNTEDNKTVVTDERMTGYLQVVDALASKRKI